MVILKRYTPIFIILIIFAIAAAGYFFVWPLNGEYTDIKKVFDIKDEEVKAKQEYLPKLEAISQRLSEYSEEIAIVNSAIPSDVSIAALFDYFEKMTAQSGLILKNVDGSKLFDSSPAVATGEFSEKIEKMPFSATLTGEYDSFKNFLKDIYLSSRMININLAEFSLIEEDSTLFDFKINLETQSYK